GLDEQPHDSRAPELALERVSGHDERHDVRDRADTRHAAHSGEQAHLADDTARSDHAEAFGPLAHGAEHLARALGHDGCAVADLARLDHQGTALKALRREPASAPQEPLDVVPQRLDGLIAMLACLRECLHRDGAQARRWAARRHHLVRWHDTTLTGEADRVAVP